MYKVLLFKLRRQICKGYPLFGCVNNFLLLLLFVPFSKAMSLSCLDIDECGTNTDNCHADANCTNTKGSFYCTCHTGYSGDGVICEGKIINLLRR